MITPPTKNAAPKLKRTANLTWAKGLVTTGGRTQTPKDGLYTAANAVMLPGGSVASRAPLYEGDLPDLPGDDFRGPIFSYYNPTDARFDVITICDGSLWYYTVDETDWQRVPEPDGPVVFDTSSIASYARFGNMVAIADAVNSVAYFTIPINGATMQVDRPGDFITTNPVMGLTGGEAEGDYRAFYLVSYVNEWGETIASGGGAFATKALSANVALANENEPLGEWSTNIVITISGVDTTLLHNARVRIYRVLSPDFIQPSLLNFQLVKEYPVTDGDKSFTDNGAAVPRVLAPQLENSTGGMAARYLKEIDGRLWAFGAGNESQKIYYSGAAPTDSIYPQFFSGEGGYFYVGYGTDSEPVTIRIGRADDGQMCNIVLCTGGRRFNIFNLSVQYGGQTVTHFYGEEQKGDEGAYSIHSVLDYMNSILYPSPIGFKSSGVRATYTNDNVTAPIDQNIQDIFLQIPYTSLKNMYGAMYNGKAIWAASPSTLLVFDARNGGAWTTWSVPHKWFGTVQLGPEREALYFAYGRQLLRYTDLAEFQPSDVLGPLTPVILRSGRLYCDPEDGRQWVHMLQGLFIFSELNGTIEITLRANSPRRTEVYKGIVSVAPSATGGVELTSGEPVDYSTIEADKRGIVSSPSAWSDGPFMVSNRQSNNSVELRCRVKKNVNYIDWEIRSLPGFNSMQLDSFVYEYVDIGVGIDFTSRYNEVRVPMVRG